MTTPLGSASARPDREGSVLLVIDMQNAYCHPDGAFARNAPDPLICGRVVPACARLIALARAAGVPVVHVAKVSFADTIPTISFHNTQRTGPQRMVQGGWDAAIVDELAPAPGEVVLFKPAYSAFFGTGLDSVLQRLAPRRIVVIGVTTSICVETTVRDAAQRAFDVDVVRDATAEWVETRHERAIEQMGYAFARIVTVADVAAAWGGHPG